MLERGVKLNLKETPQKCSLILVADGFDEVEVIIILSTLRQAGICVKSVGLTSGLIHSIHGILLMPDFALTDLERLVDISSVELVFLPGRERHLTKLEPDPRVHRLLRQVVAQQGFIASEVQGKPILKAALEFNAAAGHNKSEQMLVRYPLEQTIEQFAQSLVYRLERSVQL